jgi:TetR/AcrR family transcriptional repressor of nem operon
VSKLSASENPLLSTCFDEEDRVHSIFDGRVRALLSDQRRQLEEVTSVADLDTWRDNLVARQRSGALGCALVSLVSQLAAEDEHARIHAADYFAEWHRLIAATLRRLHNGGQLRRDADLDELATGLIAALHGGQVRARVSGNAEHMATAIDMALARIRFFAEPQ